ncbi:MAG: hypothetical protein Q4A66_07860 [Eubacteriales bacterium]|nr:hypothetical protein [Eubacteriales bacterium]
MARKKKKLPWQNWIAAAFMLSMGAACGAAMVYFLDMYAEGWSTALRYAALIGLIVIMYAAMGVQIIIHEAGHLAFGLWTGYSFSSFRVGSMVWLRQEGRLVRRKYSLAGTGGQCLLAPPPLDENGKMPVVLYNLGGSIMNLVFSALCMGLWALCPALSLWRIVFAIFALVGVAFALMNGIPLRMGAVDNDGYNALTLCKNAQSVRAFWQQMAVSDATTRGLRLRDMPANWFAMPHEQSMDNSLVAAVGVLACSRLIDEHRFAEAESRIEQALAADGLNGLYKAQLIAEKAYCELIGPCRREVVEGLMNKEQRKMMQAMKTLPQFVRLQYAHALLLERDAKKADAALASFEKIAATYPYPAEIESERELIEIARQRAAAEA